MREYRERLKEDPKKWSAYLEKKNSSRRRGKFRDRTDRACRVCGVLLTPENNKPFHGHRCRTCKSRKSRENPKNRASTLRWRREHQEELNAYQRAWRAKNPGTSSVYAESYRAKFGAARSSGCVTRAEWRARLEEFGHACAYCLRRGVRLSQDHVVPISRGGPHVIDNVVPACRSCNSRKGAKGVLSMLPQASCGHPIR